MVRVRLCVRPLHSGQVDVNWRAGNRMTGLDTLLAPGLTLMRRLRFVTKARIILGVFLLPVLILGAGAVFDFVAQRDFTVDELRGVQQLQRVLPLHAGLVRLRDERLVQTSGTDVLRGKPVQSVAELDSRFSAFAKLIASDGSDPRFVALATDWHGAWKTLAADPAAYSDGNPDTGIAPLIPRTGDVIEEVGDVSRLILDPEIETLYLGLLATQVLPPLIDNLGQLRSWGAFMAAEGHRMSSPEMAELRQRYSVWDAEVRSQIKTYLVYMGKVLAHRPDLKSDIDPFFLGVLEVYRDRAYQASIGIETEDPRELWQAGEQVFGLVVSQHDAILPVLNGLLEARLQALYARHLALAVMALLALSLAGYLFYSFYQGTVRDMHQQELDDAMLRAAKADAERANAAKSEFLANMSHEIRTPMNGIMGMTELAFDMSRDETQRRYLSTVQSSARSLLSILNGILDFSKIEAGQLQLETVRFSVRELVEDALATLEARLSRKGLYLRLNFDPALPTHVMGDPGRIRQVLLNLCDNATKFTATGGLTVTVRSAGVQGAWTLMEFQVQDTGAGIPADKQQVIFEAFSQADASTTRQYGGTGLGLTICASLVELMGGRIGVESQPGQGSLFHFSVRVETAPEVPATVPPEDMQRSAATTPTRPLKVLLVEDHPVNQLLATTLLSKWGHTVTLAENGQLAVDLFHTAPWDIVLMDMQMPVMGGLEATIRIRAMETSGHRVPIIAVTASAMESDRQATSQAGMDDHLAKPFNAAALQAILDRYCSHA
jgi:signal transduction histidine kinase/ActR/RegA family two-component response regulator